MPTKATAKKAVKKAPAKGAVSTPKKKVTASAKKAVSKKEPNFKAMVCAADGECFWTRDGRILQNISDLHMAFGSMDDEVFLHHVSKEKNDFANWMEYVLQDDEGAAALRKAKKLAQAKKILEEHLRSYNI